MSTAEAAKGTSDILGTGRRKTSVARVRLRAGSGRVLVNDRELEQYFTVDRDRNDATSPLRQTGRSDVDAIITVHGGGIHSQAGAVKLGIARALKRLDVELEPILRQHGLLTRDGRMKERKKYGLRGARRGTQFSKR